MFPSNKSISCFCSTFFFKTVTTYSRRGSFGMDTTHHKRLCNLLCGTYKYLHSWLIPPTSCFFFFLLSIHPPTSCVWFLFFVPFLNHSIVQPSFTMQLLMIYIQIHPLVKLFSDLSSSKKMLILFQI